MKFGKHFYFLYILLLVVFVAVSLFFFQKNFFKDKESIASPLPNFLTAFVNSQVNTLDLWTPILDIFNDDLKVLKIPSLSARSVLIYDLTENKNLFSKVPSEKFPMASLTKIMTAIIAIESPKKDNKYLVSQRDLVGEDSMGLSNGEILNLEELLYGLVLSSGNDAAETLASNFSLGREKFIETMNNKAKALGALHTNFTNPTGLEGDGDQHTTAYDLLIMTNYAMQIPLFRKIAGTVSYYIPYSENHKEFYLENETNLLTSYPGVMGVKDGYTPEAGLCLVTYLNYKGHKIIGILLGSDNRRQEMKDLLDYSLKLQGINPPPHG